MSPGRRSRLTDQKIERSISARAFYECLAPLPISRELPGRLTSYYQTGPSECDSGVRNSGSWRPTNREEQVDNLIKELEGARHEAKDIHQCLACG